MTRPTITGVPDAVMAEVALEAWALLDDFMSNDPTCKTIKDPEERVRAITRIHGQYMRQQWRDLRARLGEPVRDDG